MGTFQYFAYGSNLLTKRIRINNPSAVKICTGKIKGYRLAFAGTVSKAWGGCSATILPCPRSTVWGTVWQLAEQDLPSLKQQEIRYRCFDISVETSEDDHVECITFELLSPDPEGPPSPAYKSTIVNGAEESGLPKEYIDNLRSILDNGYQGAINIHDPKVAA